MQSNIGALLPGRKNCLVCNLRAKEETKAITSLAVSLSRDASRSASELSALCFPHFAMLGNAISDVDLLRSLTLRQADILERVAEDMRRYALKRDAHRRYLTSAEEDGAAERGILLASGRRQVGFT